MIKKITVLITSAGTPSTPSVIDCLKNNFEKRKIKVVCSDVFDKSIMHYKADKFHILPHGGSKNYIFSLLQLCKKEKIDVILPLSGSEILAISKNIEIFKSNNIFPAVSNYNSLQISMNKRDVYQLFLDNELPTPKFYYVNTKKEFLKAIKSLGYPKKTICFKPSSYTSTGGERGFRILRSENYLKEIVLQRKPMTREIDYETTIRLFDNHKDLDLLIMEYLPGKMISVYTFADKGKIICYAPFEIQKRDESGHAFEAVLLKNKELGDVCQKMIKKINFDFNVNFQFKESVDGKMKLLEINPRIASVISLTAAAGVNLPYLTVKKALGEILPKLKLQYGTKMIRYWKEKFVYKNSTFEI